jgi:hypothetical protein
MKLSDVCPAAAKRGLVVFSSPRLGRGREKTSCAKRSQRQDPHGKKGMKRLNLIFVTVVIMITTMTYLVGTTITGTVTGRATAVPAATVTQFGEYSLKPSFRYSMDQNFITFYLEMEKKANETRDSVIKCLEEGSGINSDSDDVITCAARGPYRGIVKTAKDLPGEYYLMFEFKQGSQVVRFAMHMQDNIAPPATENLRVAEDTNGKAYLEWDKNKASDAAGYDVYYIAKGAAYLSLSDFTKYVADVVGEKAEVTPLDYKNLDFLVVAKDEVGNFAFKKQFD